MTTSKKLMPKKIQVALEIISLHWKQIEDIRLWFLKLAVCKRKIIASANLPM